VGKEQSLKNEKMKDIKQPKPQSGFEFTGWATFNWGICHQRVFRTRTEAMAFCIGTGKDGSTWDDVKDHFRVIKVKCTVI
jgi:hypothetical protein